MVSMDKAMLKSGIIVHRSQHLDLGLFPHREIHYYKAEGQRGVHYFSSLRSLEVNLSFVNLSSDKKQLC